jgi:hypothetical protein
MSTPLIATRPLAAVLVASYLVLTCGCAGVREGEVAPRHLGAGLGAVAGAVVGGVAGQDLEAVAVGALAGGTVGYGIGWLAEQYEARQARTAPEVEEAYGPLPEGGAPRIHGYRSWVDPEAIRRGTEAGWISTFDIQVPAGTAVTVTEERLFVDPEGNTISRRTYDYSDHVTGSGGYEFELTIPIPEHAPEGRYSFEARLLLGEAGGERLVGSFQIAAGLVEGFTLAAIQGAPLRSTADSWYACRDRGYGDGEDRASRPAVIRRSGG